GQGARWRELCEPAELLPRAPLQVGGEQEWAARLAPHLTGEQAHRLGGAAEDDEPADVEGQRLPDGLPLVIESGAVRPADGGEDEPRNHHPGVMLPRTRAPRAPVHDGRLAGWPCSVR